MSDIIKICLDFESVPDGEQLDAAYAESGDFKEARRVAQLPDGNDRVRELLGDTCKPGNRKGDKLLEYVDQLEQDFERNICKDLAVDPLRCALCSVSLYTEPVVDEVPRPYAFVGSWGTHGEGESTVEALGQTVTVQALQCVERPKPLMEMPYAEQYRAERNLLLWTWSILGKYRQAFADRRAVLVTYNGAHFDVPALLARSVMHCDPLEETGRPSLPPVRATVNLSTPRYQTRPHLDLAVWVSNGDKFPPSLEKAMARMKVSFGKPEGMNGSMVYPAACEGNWPKIEAYNLPDAMVLHRAASRLFRAGVA